MVNTPNQTDSPHAQLIAVPALSDNYIWMICNNTHAVVVDPGVAQPIQDLLDQHQLTLDAILLTHHHGDHVGGVLALQQRNGGIVYGPANESLPVCDVRLAQGDTVNLPSVNLDLSVLDIPGHTAGHIAYHGVLNTNTPIVFCGDTLFAAGCGRLFEGTPEQMAASLAKLASLPLDTLVCCAHEYTLANLRWALNVEPDNPALQQQWDLATQQRAAGKPTLPTTLSTELNTNPFLRTTVPAVVAAASRHSAQTLVSPVAVFASLREWKNTFK